MLPSILIVDDEIEVLKALERLLHRDYTVVTFTDVDEALIFYRESPTHIVISDMMMPKMNGANFLKEISNINAKSKRIALTGYASAELAQQAINEGQVSRYLSKPWNNTELKALLTELVNEIKQDNKKQAILKKLSVNNNKLELEQKTHNIVHNLMLDEQQNNDKQTTHLKSVNNELLILNANLIAMYSKEVAGHSVRVAQQAKVLAVRLGLEDKECGTIYIAALFHRLGIGIVSTDADPDNRNGLSEQERQEHFAYVQASADVMDSASSLKRSANIVRHIYEQVDGHGAPEHLNQAAIPNGSLILRLLIEFDLLVSGCVTGEVISPNEAFLQCKEQVGTIFDSTIYQAFVDMYISPQKNEKFQQIKLVAGLQPMMVLAQDLYDSQEHKLLTEGSVLTALHIEHLINIQHQQECMLLVYVYHLSQ
jgi:response regulator RpfG family c-di-GMP phosphodiesterase